jgi:chemotaxis protein CheZ
MVTMMSDPLQKPDPERDTVLMAELHDLTCNLRVALERFRYESHLSHLTEKEIPDARQRLDHVMKLTDSAAHRTLDLVEQVCPAAERTASEAAALTKLWAQFRARQIAPTDFQELLTRMDKFLTAAQRDSAAVRKNLGEVLVAQGYQDLTGQIIRSVMTLVGEVERILSELTRIARNEQESGTEPPAELNSLRTGPAVPGVDADSRVVTDQEDVDTLLSKLGM